MPEAPRDWSGTGTKARGPGAAGAKTIELALQGGGAHGAFTWGVLDRLLADPRLVIEYISGTSAGAMNAVVLADGMHRGGAEGARRSLAKFWRAGGGWPGCRA
jgi:NTE family protein